MKRRIKLTFRKNTEIHKEGFFIAVVSVDSELFVVWETDEDEGEIVHHDLKYWTVKFTSK